MHGTQFIADLMPKTPIYTAMLAESARTVMGVPHPSGRAAMKMLEREGFAYDCYVDIFDGGPTMSAQTDQIRTIRQAREHVLAGVKEDSGERRILATGHLRSFRACYGQLSAAGDGPALVDPASAASLGIAAGDSFISAAG
jgi:arginine N-succinyltransferase